MKRFIRLLRSWKIKLFTLCALALVNSAVVGVVLTISLKNNNDQIESSLAQFAERQAQSSGILSSLLHFNSALQNLIAEDELDEIRKYSVLAIRNASLVEESIHNLLALNTGNDYAQQLAYGYQELRPLQLKVISLGKKNRDEEALAQLKNISDKNSALMLLAERSSEAERSAFSSVLGEQRQSNEKLVYFVLAVVITGGFLLMGYGFYLAHKLMYGFVAIRQAMKSFSDGYLKPNVDYPRTDELGRTINHLEKALVRVQAIVRGIMFQIDVLNENSHNLEDVSASTRQQSEAVYQQIEQIQSRIDELSCISADVDAHLVSSLDSSANASSISQQTSRRIQATFDSFNVFKNDLAAAAEKTEKLSDSAATISEITGAIRAISEQTNLLALNAAIEAARAGEQGRGFAVVADEVRTLAQRSGDAVEEISALAGQMRESVDGAVGALHKASEGISRNVEELSAASTSTLQASASAEEALTAINSVQGLNTQQIIAIDGISSASKSLLSLSDNSHQSVESLDELSIQLANISRSLTESITHFK